MKDRPRVLIVDDTPENILMLSATLKDDFTLTTATNGEEALAVASQVPHPDLILLNVCMPDICEILKKTPGCAKIPMVFVSSAEEERVGLAAGAVDDITRSFHPELKLPPARYRSPQTGGCDIATVLPPARASSGNFYNYLHLSPHKVLFTLGNVSDKGVPSALFMVRVVALLHWLAPTINHPSNLLVSLNQALCLDNQAGMFVTLGCGLVDLEKGEILYASGGHEQPILVTPGQPARQLKVEGGPVLGLYQDAKFPAHGWTLRRGQTLLLSDGLSLLERLGFLEDCSPTKVVDAVEGDALTLLALQPGSSRHYHWKIACELRALPGFTESLHQSLRESGCSKECLNDLDLVTEELLVNTILYGCPEGARETSIEVSLWADAYHVQLVLRDNGIAFNPLEAVEREEDKVGGWGIPLIKTLMDQFDYQRIGEINEITIVRREREN